MTPDALPPQTEPPGPETPPASLTMVRVKRRRSTIEPSGKRGDLTQQLMAAASNPAPTVARNPVPVAETTAAPAIALTPPAEPAPESPPPAEPAEAAPLDLDTVPLEMPPMPRLVVEADERQAEVPAPVAAPRLVVDTAQDIEPAPEPEPEPVRYGPGPRSADDIIDYWDSLRGARDFPALDDLDRNLIADCWPNSVLLAFAQAQGEAPTPRITRLGEPNGEIEYTAMVTDWILSRGRYVAKRGDPMEEEQRFPVSTGSARYRLLLLPFSSYGLQSDHVLCHLSRTQELSPAAAFKRWLAS